MDSFSFTLPETSLLFGKGTLAELGPRAAKHGKRALLVSGKGAMRKLGFLEKAQKGLEAAGLKVTLFEGIEPNPSVATVAKGIELGLRERCDVVVALGGGSTIDAAKSIAVGIGHGDSDVWSYVCCKKPTTGKTLPIIAIPSTSGTGSHVTWFTVVTNEKTNEKAAYASKFIFPKESIVDIDIVARMPTKVTAETGFDALAHVMEAYLSKRANPITDLLCLRAIELIAQNLPRAVKDGEDFDARYAMAVADTYAGICITSSRTIMVHGIGNTVSGVHRQISHGQALACLTPPVMRFNVIKGDDTTMARYCDIAKALGADITAIDKKNALMSAESVERLIKAIGLKARLSECGAGEDSIEKMTDISMQFGTGAMACNPVKPTRADIVRIYNESF